MMSGKRCNDLHIFHVDLWVNDSTDVNILSQSAGVNDTFIRYNEFSCEISVKVPNQAEDVVLRHLKPTAGEKKIEALNLV